MKKLLVLAISGVGSITSSCSRLGQPAVVVVLAVRQVVQVLVLVLAQRLVRLLAV